MIHLGLIGYPLGHSLSPKIHTAALKACGLQGYYSLFPIHDVRFHSFLIDIIPVEDPPLLERIEIWRINVKTNRISISK
ncbi:MAG: hypothetical protein ACXW4Q_02030 [Anaerolineales bacterium]